MDTVIQLSSSYVAMERGGDVRITPQYRPGRSGHRLEQPHDMEPTTISHADAIKLRDFLNHHLGK